MYELIKINENDYYFDCPSKIGLVKTSESECVLIDSGSDKDVGKKIFKAIEANGWHLNAIYITHSHADHIGGNRFLQDKTGCKIYAPYLEEAFVSYPILEPINLYGGRPFPDLKHKFLLAQESNVEKLTSDVLPCGMSVIELPGHCFNMVGYMTKDRTAYIADCLSSEATLNKYGIGVIWDAEKTLETLDYITTLDADILIPSHAEPTKDIAPLAEFNKKSINKTLGMITEICKAPSAFEDILRQLFDSYGMTMSAQQYVLVGSTVRSTLSLLYEQGKLTFEFCDNRMLWKTVG